MSKKESMQAIIKCMKNAIEQLKKDFECQEFKDDLESLPYGTRFIYKAKYIIECMADAIIRSIKIAMVPDKVTNFSNEVLNKVLDKMEMNGIDIENIESEKIISAFEKMYEDVRDEMKRTGRTYDKNITVDAAANRVVFEVMKTM